MKLQRRWGWIFISPTLALFIIFFLAPLGYSAYLSLHKADIYGRSFVGLTNYINLVQSDLFRLVVRNTGLYWIGIVPACVILPFLLAIIIMELPQRVASFFRATFYLPTAIGGIVIATIWRWFYNPTHGLFNWLLGLVGISKVSWLGDPRISLFAVCLLIIVGGTVSSYTLIYCAALSALSRELIEAAKIDGANVRQIIWYIVRPALHPTINYTVLTTSMAAFSIWAFPKILTAGGPVHSSTSFGYWIYETGFIYGQLGRASAQAIIMLFLTLGISVAIVRVGYDIS